jgi:AcrR family transcriptional regulator
VAGSTSREELIAAARAHLDEHGLDGLTLREVARRAGVSHGAPLRHFPSLAALCSAVAADAFDGLYAQVAAAMDEVVVDDARRRLHAAGRGYLRFAVANPGPFHLMFHRELCDVDDPHLTAASGAAFAQLLYATSEAQAAGWRPDEPTAEAAALLWAQVHGLATLHLLGSLPRAVAGNGGDPDLFHLFDRSYEALAADPGRTP